MLISRKENETVKHYKLQYFNGEIDLQNLSNGSVIYPNYEFWTPYFGLKPIEEIDQDWIHRKAEYERYYENDWVEKELWLNTFRKCEELEIDPIHLNNICVPLSHFPFASLSMLGDDINEVADDVQKLQDLFVELENNYKKVTSIKFTVGQLQWSEDLEDRYKEIGETTISVERAITPLMDAFIRLAKTDVKLNQLVFHSGYRHYREFDLQAAIKNEQTDLIKMLHTYLVKNNLCRSERNGFIKTGKFISIVDRNIVADEDYYYEVYHQNSDYDTYDDFVYGQIKQRMKRHPIKEYGTRKTKKRK